MIFTSDPIPLRQGVTSCMLQLLAAACLSLASKQEEVLQPTPEEWSAIAAGAFTAPDLLSMEAVVLGSLGWRGRTPTGYVFLQLLSFGLGLDCGGRAFNVARQLLERSLLDLGFVLRHDYLTAAAASLVTSVRRTQGGMLEPAKLQALAPFLRMEDVSRCAVHMEKLQDSDVII